MSMQKTYESVCVERKIRTFWDESGIYKCHSGVEAGLENQSRPLYSVDTPPPTVSGALHIGHIFSYTQTDIIVRYHRMNGFEIFYPFGFDDNGLATERFVEKKRNIRSHMMSRADFIQNCLEETAVAEKQFKELWQHIGLSVDWQAEYSTIDQRSRTISQRSFIELYKKGYAYRRNKPAPFCTCCRTSVAQAELDDAEKQTIFYDIAFTDESGHEYIIATTRPELLYSCVAVLFNPQDTRYNKLAISQLLVPLYARSVPLIADEKVLIEKGSGLVMCCTFGDSTDVEWAAKYNLPYIQSIGRDGKFVAQTAFLAGKNVEGAREIIVSKLQNCQLIRAQKAITHTVHIHERCKNPIEYISLMQWFLQVTPYKQDFLACADQIEWYPAFMKSRYRNWVENINWDWCLSRQRLYGIPFPVWHCSACETVILAQRDQLPIDPQETPYIGNCPSCGSDAIVADTDIMDTWNTSSLTPYICKSIYENSTDTVFDTKSNFLPMGMRPQAHDIIRTWAFYTIVKAWMHSKTLPWKEIVISGHVLSTDKQKISKSVGNSPLIPENLLAQYSADAVRYWTATGALGQDTAFSDTQLRAGNRLVVKLWNAFRFIEEHFSPQETSYDNYPVHAWILHRASQSYDQYVKAFEKREPSIALEHIDTFFWHDVCDTYLEIIKDQLFKPELYAAEEVAATRYTLYLLGLRIIQLYAPFVPYVCEELYQNVYRLFDKKTSIHTTDFVAIQKPFSDEHACAQMKIVQKIVISVRRMKSQSQLSLKTPLVELLIGFEQADDIALVEKLTHIIAGVCCAQKVVLSSHATFTDHVCQEAEMYRMGIIIS